MIMPFGTTLSAFFVGAHALALANANIDLVNSIRSTDSSVRVDINWQSCVAKLKTSPTLQVVTNPMLLANSSIRTNALNSLRLVASDYTRFVPWFPYPKLAVAELDPPVINGSSCKTSWNFTYPDQMIGDFFASNAGHNSIINFPTIPLWMFNVTSNTYATDVTKPDWLYGYSRGISLRDPSFKEVSDYFARLVSWYVNGGFTDECGVYHKSGHKYTIDYWEVLNEPEFEHNISPELYNQLYDAIVTAIHTVSPNTVFVGLAANAVALDYMTEFLDPSKHKAGVPLDWFSYHFYAQVNGTGPDGAALAFQQADSFIHNVSDVEAIRKRLAPRVKTTIDELGTIDNSPGGGFSLDGSGIESYQPAPEYFVWSGAMYAYVFSHLAALGIDVVGESQLVGYPGQFPSVSMVDWKTGLPNARLRVLQLLQKHFPLGDSIIQTSSSNVAQLHAQAFTSTAGDQKLLLVNKLPGTCVVSVPNSVGAVAEIVDLSTNAGLPRTMTISGPTFQVPGYASVVVTMKKSKGSHS